MPEDITPKLINVELVSPGWINKYVLTYRMANGSDYTYESISRKGLEDYRAELERLGEGKKPIPDAVSIVPILPDDSFLLQKEFRYALNSWVIAFPAGLIGPGETIEECIDRELREETGYAVRTDLEQSPISLLPQSGFSSTGLSEENIQIALVYAEKVGDPSPDKNELIEPFTLKRSDVGEFLSKNEIPIGQRTQLLLEASRRLTVLRKRLVLALQPLTDSDFA
ncbi:MAG: NUDIX hydrolase [Eggerthellaceae bacterium]|nr:NUDIX hydrolase [Eggerthellaceae bacterium]